MSAYLSYFKLRFKVNLQYRSAAIAGICTQLFFGIVYIFLYNAFYESGNEAMLPMSFTQICSYIWLQQALYALIYPFSKDTEIIEEIKTGNLAYELIKPQSYYWKNYVKMLSKRVVNVLLRAPIVLLIAFLLPKPFSMVVPNNLSTFLFFIVSLLISTFLVTAINLLMHILLMFTIDDTGIMALYRVSSEILAGLAIPVAFFPTVFQKIVYALPFCYIADFPLRVYSGNIGLMEAKGLIILSIIWLVILIIVGNIVAKLALKKAVVQGG